MQFHEDQSSRHPKSPKPDDSPDQRLDELKSTNGSWVPAEQIKKESSPRSILIRNPDRDEIRGLMSFLHIPFDENNLLYISRFLNSESPFSVRDYLSSFSADPHQVAHSQTVMFSANRVEIDTGAVVLAPKDGEGCEVTFSRENGDLDCSFTLYDPWVIEEFSRETKWSRVGDLLSVADSGAALFATYEDAFKFKSLDDKGESFRIDLTDRVFIFGSNRDPKSSATTSHQIQIQSVFLKEMKRIIEAFHSPSLSVLEESGAIEHLVVCVLKKELPSFPLISSVRSLAEETTSITFNQDCILRGRGRDKIDFTLHLEIPDGPMEGARISFSRFVEPHQILPKKVARLRMEFEAFEPSEAKARNDYRAAFLPLVRRLGGAIGAKDIPDSFRTLFKNGPTTAMESEAHERLRFSVISLDSQD